MRVSILMDECLDPFTITVLIQADPGGKKTLTERQKWKKVQKTQQTHLFIP